VPIQSGLVDFGSPKLAVI